MSATAAASLNSDLDYCDNDPPLNARTDHRGLDARSSVLAGEISERRLASNPPSLGPSRHVRSLDVARSVKQSKDLGPYSLKYEVLRIKSSMSYGSLRERWGQNRGNVSQKLSQNELEKIMETCRNDIEALHNLVFLLHLHRTQPDEIDHLTVAVQHRLDSVTKTLCGKKPTSNSH
jgi:hypothetical protein